MTYYSQHGTWQDRWVDEQIGTVDTGTFLDIGCGHWQKINNTLFFEERGWRGVAIDSNPALEENWLIHRPRSRFVLGDARELDYLFVLQSLPHTIDYLSIDLEPPDRSLEALRQVMFTSGRQFRAITFEHDEYRKTGIREPAREFLAGLGYRWVEERNEQDDFFLLDI